MINKTNTLIPEEVRKIIDSYPELNKALSALYLEVEAGIAEDIEVKVAKAINQSAIEAREEIEKDFVLIRRKKHKKTDFSTHTGRSKVKTVSTSKFLTKLKENYEN